MKFQSPRGTRDFFPEQMAWRSHLIQVWRRVAIRNGFEEIEGPTFETLDLYKVKSGEGIVSELFHFEDRGGRELALRPEFTPTLARMVAEKASALPRPIKWFAVPNCYRAERPQRGRLREFLQWNADLIGVEGAAADAECIFTLVDLLAELGLRPDQVKVKISHRDTVRQVLAKLGVPDERMLEAFDLLDRRDKMEREAFTAAATKLGLDPLRIERFEQMCRRKYPAGDVDHLCRSIAMEGQLADLEALDKQLRGFGIADWCEYDLGIVRGLAYYTGLVFEIHEVSGAERAMAGGGRYDNLVELFGGPSLPAVGFGMGDVVLTNVLIDKGLAPRDVRPVPDVFVVAASDAGAAVLPGVVGRLRRAGLHTRFSYRPTRNLGKLLKEAAASGARQAVILDDQVEQGRGAIKDLLGGGQAEVAIGDLSEQLSAVASTRP
jgi:histidyl-tRNA synthetase